MILLVGGLGSIGQRYQAILKYLGVAYQVFDPAQGDKDIPTDWTQMIIASPTGTHVGWCLHAEHRDKPYLCEKPLTKSGGNIPISQGYMVCNYKYLIEPGQSVFYNYYKTGTDGLLWDCCQLVYLDPAATLLTTSPRWHLTANSQPITYRELENSYVSMLRDFTKGNYENLWTIEQGKEMTQVVLERVESENRSNTSQIQLNQTA